MEITKTEREDGTSSTKYEYASDRNTYFSVTIEHDYYDTLPRSHISDIQYSKVTEVTYDYPSTPEPSYQQEKPSHESRSSGCSFDHNDYLELQRDKSLDDYQRNDRSDYLVDTPVSDNVYHKNQIHKKEHTLFYLWFKKHKETWIGPSKETLQKQRDAYIQAQQEYKQLSVHAKSTLTSTQIQDKLKSEFKQACTEHLTSINQSKNQEFLRIVNQRTCHFQNHLRTFDISSKNYKFTNSALGFMKAFGVDPDLFYVKGSDIQHHLTKEMALIFEALADLATTHIQDQSLYTFIQANVYMAVMTQDYNQQIKLLDTISSANCTHGLLYCLQGMIDSGVSRCQKLATSLAFFSCEVAKYANATARGVTQGIITSEISIAVYSAIGSLSSTIAPQLTAAVYTGIARSVGPIAVTAGLICSALIITECARCGYYYTTHDVENLHNELKKIQEFASYFYNFDQAPEKHVENLARISTTLGWPFIRDSVFETLQGIQKVTCTIMLQKDVTVSATKKMPQHELHAMLDHIKNNELKNFEFHHQQIKNEHFLNFVETSKKRLALGAVDIEPIPEQKILLSQFTQQANVIQNKALPPATQVIYQQYCDDMFKYCTPAFIEGVTTVFQTTPLSPKYLEMLASLQPYELEHILVPGIEHIQEIRQIDNFRNITKNFTDISKLTSYEILYLNYCNWFYPTYCKINAKVKLENLEICIDNEIIKIDKFGLYHMYLNDMKPIKESPKEAFRTALYGGHMLFPNLKFKTHKLSDFKLLDNGYFELRVKHIDDASATEPTLKTFCPFGTTPEEDVDMIIQAIKNPKHIKSFKNKNLNIKTAIVTDQNNQEFKISITNNTAVFFRSKEEIKL